MKKRNLVMQAAVAGVFALAIGSANAASAISVTSIKYANEQFSGSAPNQAIVGPTTSVIAATAIPLGSILTVQVELGNAVFAVTQAGVTSSAPAANFVSIPTGNTTAAPTCTMGSTTAGVTGAAAGSATASATASNANVVSCQFTTSYAIGIGGTVMTITTPSLNAAALAVSGTTVTATGSILVGSVAAPVGAAVATTGTLEGASPATKIAESGVGITITASAGTAGKIDLTATPVASAFDSSAVLATNVDLGRITVTNGTTKVVDGTTTYTIANKGTSTLVATVTAPAGFFAALKTTGYINLAAATCSGASLASSAVFATNAAAAAATSVSTAAALPVTTTVYHVCMTIPTSGSTSVALVPGTPSLTAVLGAAAAQDSTDSLASTALWPLAYNGSQYDVRNYVPSGATGYISYVRVINTGSVTAAVSAAVIDATTGVAGTSGVLGTLAAGAAQNYSSTQVEAAAGAVAATARPRIRITAPTNTLQVQTFLALPSGDIVDMTGAQ